MKNLTSTIGCISCWIALFVARISTQIRTSLPHFFLELLQEVKSNSNFHLLFQLYHSFSILLTFELRFLLMESEFGVIVVESALLNRRQFEFEFVHLWFSRSLNFRSIHFRHIERNWHEKKSHQVKPPYYG